MIPWEHLADAPTPGGDTLRLFRRGAELSIRLPGGNELMSSRLSGSEEALAQLTIAALGNRAAPRVLIGGLGMGFTLRTALAALDESASVQVVEIVPELLDWAQGPMAEVFGTCLDDRRVDVVIADVAAVIRAAREPFDAILLDVDNGPDGLTRPQNDTLYDDHGLTAMWRALAPGGVLSVWSAYPSPGFAARLDRAGFDVATHKVRAGRARRGAKHIIWTARRD